MPAVFKTRFYPYLFVIVFLGFLSVVCLNMWISHDTNSKYAQYYLLIFAGSLIFFVMLLIANYTSLTIYYDRLVMERIFTGTRDEIIFAEVESATIKNLMYSGVDEGNRENSEHVATLNLWMKDGQELEVNLNEYNDLETIISTIKATELWTKNA